VRGNSLEGDALRGQLLIASPALLDPNFRRTVVLIGEHGEEGAMGVVLNRPTEIEVAQAVPALGELVAAQAHVYAGGPVDPDHVVVLAEWDDPGDAASIVFGSVGFMPADADPALVAASTGRVRVFGGHAGWSPGQLESELEEESWIVEQAAPDDVFAAGDLWSAVLRRKGGGYRVLALMPEDPSVN
jgi:putative transcriptional regulator